LELACGTARLLIPIAKAGYKIVGIDFSQNMLDLAKRKINEHDLEDQITLIHGNMTHFSLDEKSFALAFIAARSFMHLYSQKDQLSCLNTVIEHLRPGGLFIIDVYSPNLEILSLSQSTEFKLRKRYVIPNGNRVKRKDRFVENDFLNQISKWEMLFEEYDKEGNLIQSRLVPMDTRYTFRYELQLLLEKVGFEIRSIYSDYDKRLYDGKGEIIMVSKKPG
jgi:ubiquinone/menaquinone biosynthesis C-methylase UbiE